jgi:hypothetical protein
VAKHKQNKGSRRTARKRAIAKQLRRDAERMGLPSGAMTEGYIETKSTTKPTANPKMRGLRSKGGSARGQGQRVNLRTGRS